MKRFESKNWILVALFVLFLLPGISAIWCFFHPTLLKGELVNKGHLLKPAILVKELSSNSWQLLYRPQQECTEECLQAVTKLAKVRLSLGRHLYGLALNVLLTPSDKGPSLKVLKEMDIGIKTVSEKNTSLAKYHVWIVDPKGYVVMVYKDETDPKDIFTDLQHFSPLWG